MVRPELQRLLARGPNALPDHLVVDVGAIARWINETDPNADPWPDFFEAVRRSHRWRSYCWVVATTLVPSRAVTRADLSALHARLEAEAPAGAVIASEEPLVSLIKSRPSGPKLGLVTAGIDSHRYELDVLDAPVAVVLDIATGKSREGQDAACEEDMEPIFLPQLEAIVGTQLSSPPLGTRDAPKYRHALARALDREEEPSTADVPQRLRKALHDRAPKIHRAQETLRTAPADARARAAFAHWYTSPPPWAANATSAPVVPRVLHDVHYGVDGELKLSRLVVMVGETVRYISAPQASRALKDLQREMPQRWFVVQSLDLLGWMADNGLVLPKSVFDPGLAAFALDPDQPTGTLPPSSASLPGPIVSWIFDRSRTRQPPRQWELCVDALPAIENDLQADLTTAGLAALYDDVGATLPALARIERQGAWVECSACSWETARRRAQMYLARLEPLFLRYLKGADPYAPRLEEIVRAFKKTLGPLPESRWLPTLRPEQEFARFAHLHRPAQALKQARAVAFAASKWLDTIPGKQRLRGRQTPQKTGRWGFVNEPLHSLPSSGPLAKSIRARLYAPPGYRLMAIDYAGHEMRLLAGLSGDPFLMQIARAHDLHKEFARRYLGSEKLRNLAKACAHPLMYGQTERGFIEDRFDMDAQHAQALYQYLLEEFPHVFAYRKGVVAQAHAAQALVTPGGWRRRITKENEIFSTLVQGLAADMFRHVLRRLDEELMHIDAFVVHQAHDEVYLAFPPEYEREAREIAIDAMTFDVAANTRLVPKGIQLMVSNPRVGETWADLL